MLTNISLCMIVKNEEELLPRALREWREAADELIVVDTGSSDDTKAVAASHGAKVMDYAWAYPGHKGAARNVGLEAASGAWAFVLDADEVIRHAAQVRMAVAHIPPEMDGLHLTFENYDEEGHCILRWHQPRIFRRELFRYRHREHELPMRIDGGPESHGLSNIIIEHRPPAARTAPKVEPMLERLRLDVAEWPSDPAPAYFYHRQLLIAGKLEEAIGAGMHYLNLAGDKDMCECYGNMANAYGQLGQLQEAIRWLHRAAAEQPERKVWWIEMAELYMEMGKWQVALATLRHAAELWPSFEWQTLPAMYGAHMQELIEKCQSNLAATHHSH